MKRNEACLLLTRIAQNELVDKELSKALMKARDVVICEYNGVLDALATVEIRKDMKDYLMCFLENFQEQTIFDIDIRKEVRELESCLFNKTYSKEFYEKCEEMYLPTRCKNCPNYAGCENNG